MLQPRAGNQAAAMGGAANWRGGTGRIEAASDRGAYLRVIDERAPQIGRSAAARARSPAASSLSRPLRAAPEASGIGGSTPRALVAFAGAGKGALAIAWVCVCWLLGTNGSFVRKASSATAASLALMRRGGARGEGNEDGTQSIPLPEEGR